MKARNKVVALSLLVIALVLLALMRHWHLTPTAPRPAAETAPQAATGAQRPEITRARSQRDLETEVARHGVTLETAKLEFGLLVGSLPGVDIAGIARDPTDFDGTPAIADLYKVWEQLSLEQRQAAARLIHRGPVPATGSPRAISAGWLPALDLSGFRLRPVADKFAYDYEGLAKDASGTLALFLNVPPIVNFTVTVDDDPPQGTEYAHTWSWYWAPEYPNKPDVQYLTGCEISVHNQKFVGLGYDDAKAIVTHEMFHCYQDQTAGSGKAMVTVSKWISEGEATWAMLAVVPSASDAIMGNKWLPYVNNPDTYYKYRSYDAVGVYGHMSDVAGDSLVWPALLPMVSAVIAGSDDDALQTLLRDHKINYFTSWGSSYFRDSGHVPWSMIGPGTPLPFTVTPTNIEVNSDSVEMLGPADSDRGKLFKLTGSPDILMVALMTGYGRLHDANYGIDKALDASGPLALCLKAGGCKCPDGSPGASLITERATGPLSIGINGGDDTAMVGVVGKSLDGFCKKPDPTDPDPTNPGGGGGGGGGGDDDEKRPQPPPEGTSQGDTHLTTLDGLRYDFQVVGEYTLVRSTTDDFLIQVRQVPVRGRRVASVNQAVAMRVGGQRVSFTLENGHTVMRIDGTSVSGESPPPLKGGVLTSTSNAYGDSYQVAWPDGTVVRIEPVGSYALNVRVVPAATRRGKLEGLLGNLDGAPDNDLVGSAATRLGITPSRDDINHSLADAWRIEARTSLFDYQAGQSSEQFFDPTFPARDVDYLHIPNRDAAEKACREEGITDAHLLEDCILDLAATNEILFGKRYAQAQRVLATRAALLTPAAAGPQRATIWLTGQILDTKPVEQHFDAKQGDVIWVWGPDCTDADPPTAPDQFHHTVGMMLLDPTGKQIGPWAMSCHFGRRELPVAGTYTLRFNFGYHDETVHWHIPIRFIRHTRREQVTYGQAISGRIDSPGDWDIYTFSAKAGDLIALEGEGCSLESIVTAIVFPDGHDVLGPGCRRDTYFKIPADGTYQLVINSDNSPGAGVYHFVFQGGKLAP